MINESDCNCLAITELLVDDHPGITSTITKHCQERNIEVTIIKGAADYWCRDFMPLQVSKDSFVQFVYDPSYYKYPGYCHLKTDVSKVSYCPKGTIHNSDILLDGGNVCYCDKHVIVSDKVFKDNPSYTKTKLVDTLASLLGATHLTIVPAVPYDITGHSDGMIRFVNSTTLLVNDLRAISSPTYWQRLLKSLRKYNVILLPNDLYKNKITDDATGDYINTVLIKDLVFVPVYNTSTDDVAHKVIQDAFPAATLIPVPSGELSVKAGVLHCATWNYLA